MELVFNPFTSTFDWVNVESPGAGGDLNYVQSFTNEDEVVVNHNLGKYPTIAIVDTANDEVEGQVVHDSINQLTLTFSAPFSGKVFCN